MKDILRAFLNPRMGFVFLLGISSGLPYKLPGETLKIWLAELKVDIRDIGLFTLVGLPYTLKFLWSPLMDRYVPPFLGRRRGWIMVCQLVGGLVVVAMALTNPSTALTTTAILAFLISFMGASQDITIDAYRRDVLRNHELGLGSSMATNGYQVGMLIVGAGSLYVAHYTSWQTAYLAMAAILFFAMIVTFFAPEPEEKVIPPRTLQEAVIAPLAEFFQRKGVVEVLAFILLYKIGDGLASTLTSPFYIQMGFSKPEIASIAKLYGFWATIGGGLLGGLLMVTLGMYRSLWIFGILQMVSTFGFSLQAQAGHNLTYLTGVITFENLTSGMGSAAYAAFMASLCNRRFTATQYALLTSLMGVPRIILGGYTGYLQVQLGWYGFFIFCTLVAIPGLLLLFRFKRWAVAES